MARTPRTVELSTISLRVTPDLRSWLERRMKETGRQSLNEVVNDLVEDARAWLRVPAPIAEALEHDRKSRKVRDAREYIVGLLLEKYVALQQHKIHK